MDTGSISAIPRYLGFIALFIIGGAYFSAAETAFASVNEIRMISGADDGDKRAGKVLYILDNFDKALTTLLIGTNIMHIACSSMVTLMASKIWGNKAVTASTFVITFIVFIFVEMIPKSYAKACSEVLAPRLAGSLIFLMKLLTPISFLFSGISKLVTKIVGTAPEEEPTVSEEELFDIIENIDEEDDIDEDEAELVQSALEMTVKPARDILIPWDKVVCITPDMDDDAILDLVENTIYSRFPVVNAEGLPTGILQTRKFLKSRIRRQSGQRSRASLDKLFYAEPQMPVDELMDDMSSNRVHMALIKDPEEGHILGIVTMEDILEELVGEIHDEDEARAARRAKLAQKAAEKKGRKAADAGKKAKAAASSGTEGGEE
jgi:CBS domain containing-hemolysin-like protein